MLARRAGGREDDDRQVLVDGQLDRARELLAHHGAHAAAEVVELEDAEHGGNAADARDAGDDRLLQRGLLVRRPHAVAVALGVLEVERIARREPGLALLEGARIGEQPDALARADAERVAALRAHAPAALDLRAVHDLLAGVALDPQALGDVDLRGLAGRLFGLASEPGHLHLGGGLRPPSDRRRAPPGALLRASPLDCAGKARARAYAEGLLERGDEVADPVDERGGAGVRFDRADDGGADPPAVGDLAPRGGPLRG